MAAGILAVGFMLVAATFPVGTKLTVLTTERTVAGMAANEAIVKIQLYGIDTAKLSADEMVLFSAEILDPVKRLELFDQVDTIATANGWGFTYNRNNENDLNEVVQPTLDHEQFYPSVEKAFYQGLHDLYPTKAVYVEDEQIEQRYWWSALCRRDAAEPGRVHVTVFVNRKTGDVQYPDWRETNPFFPDSLIAWPVPYRVEASQVQASDKSDEIVVTVDFDGEVSLFGVDSELILEAAAGANSRMGQRFIVTDLVRDTSASPMTVTLVVRKADDPGWSGWGPGENFGFWVTPVATSGSRRYPCIKVLETSLWF